MTLDIKSPDSLSLGLVKQHLVVSHNLDDTLIQSYIDASLFTSEKYINHPITSESYVSIIDDSNIYEIPHIPSNVYLYLGGALVSEIDFTYNYPYLTLTLDGTEVFDNIKADVQGADNASITQARLLMIGSSYRTRENEDFSNLKATELSTKFLLDLNETSFL